MVRTTSTSGITGTGLKKCIPISRSGRFVAAAISEMVSDDVFDAKMTSSRQCSSSSRQRAFFTSRSSTMASITRSAAAAPSPSRSPARRAATAGRFASSFTLFANSSFARASAASM